MAWRPNAANLYRTLLLAYPADFREEYGTEMERVFQERLRFEPGIRVWTQAFADAAVLGPREHFQILAQDLRFGARMLVQSPGFAVVAVLTMALGVGPATAVFSLVNAVLIRSLPYGNPARLVYVWSPNSRFGPPVPREIEPFNADYYDWQRLSRSFSHMAGFSSAPFDLGTEGASDHVGGAHVTGNFFKTLEVPPLLGRAIDPEDDQPGHDRVAVISYAFWQTKFAGSPSVLQSPVILNKVSYRIVGVMPPGFQFPRHGEVPYGKVQATDVWIPVAFTPEQRGSRESGENKVIARLAPGVSVHQAQAEMSAIAAQTDLLYPAGNRGWGAYIAPLTETVAGPVRTAMLLLLGAVFLVLAIAAINVANLLIARASERVHEIGVRAALGAGRGRLIRQMVTEALLLASAGGALGMSIAFGAVHILAKLNPGNIPRIEETSVDGRVLFFALAISLGTGILFGLLPAFSATRRDVTKLLKLGGGKGPISGSSHLRQALIVAEVGLSTILLAGSGLLIRSYLKLQSNGPGFSLSTLTTRIFLPERYSTPQQRTAFYRDLMTQLARLPGVENAGAVTNLPFGDYYSIGFFEVDGYSNQKGQTVNNRAASPDYFRAMGVPLIDGRFFEDRDADSEAVPVIVNEAFARKYFAGQSAVGKHLRAADMKGTTKSPWWTVVGEIGNARFEKVDETPQPELYRFLDQTPWESVFLAVRSAAPPRPLASAVRMTVQQMDASVGIDQFHTMDDRTAEAWAPRRFQTVLLSAFAGLALVLALVGLYGLMAYIVRLRTPEMGIRLALGAPLGSVLGMILRQGVRMALAGVALGLAGAFAVTRFLASWLYDVSPADPLTFIVAPLLLLLVATAACLIPARRATRISPLAALRSE